MMKAAIAEAQKAFDQGEVPVGALIVAGNRIVARTHNLTETLNDVTAHAEMQAFTAATHAIGSKYLNDCTLYVTLEPCVMCAGAAFWSRIGRIVWGAPDPKRGYRLANPNILHPATKVTEGVLSEECSAILQEFFIRKR